MVAPFELKPKYFDNSESLNNYVKDSSYTGSNKLCAAIEIKEFDHTTNQFTIVIR